MNQIQCFHYFHTETIPKFFWKTLSDQQNQFYFHSCSKHCSASLVLITLVEKSFNDMVLSVLVCIKVVDGLPGTTLLSHCEAVTDR